MHFAIWKNKFFNLDKYILRFGNVTEQSRIKTEKNEFINLNKYILKFGQILRAILDQNRRKTNEFINSEKYILKFGQIYLAIWTNMRATSMWPSNPGSKQTENTLIFQHMPSPPKWICHGHDGVLSDFNVSQLRQMMRMAKFKEKLSQISVFVKSKICSPILCFYQQKYVDFRSLQIEYHFHVIEFKW